MIDAPVTIRVDDAAGSSVALAVVTADAAGNGWRSSREYPVGPGGTLQLDDPDRPWWDMDFVDSTRLPVAFRAPATALRYQLTVTTPQQSSTAITTRYWGRGVHRELVSGSGWRLHVFRAPDEEPRPAVVIVPGAGGLVAAAPAAALLASHGCTAAVLAYMQEDGLPASFAQLPVEAINAGLRTFTGPPAVDAQRVSVLAYSIGTGPALSALTRREAPEVRSVIAVAPTHVVWQALGAAGRSPKVSSLTLGGRDLHYVPTKGGRLQGQLVRNRFHGRFSEKRRSAALVLKAAYETALNDPDAVSAAAIPAERISAPLLTIAGEGDAVWPAAQMARALAERRGERPGDRLLILPGAGHVLAPPATPTTVDRTAELVAGGSPAGTAHGQRRAWDAIVSWLLQ